MKFGKEYKRHMVPEWVEMYMDYKGLKGKLQEIRTSQVPKWPATSLRAIQQGLSMCRPFRRSEVETKTPTTRTTEYRCDSNTVLGGQDVCSLHNKGDLEDQVAKVSPFVGDGNRTLHRKTLLASEEIGGDDDVKFFQKLDEELNKVNAFYRNKVEELVDEAAELDKQMDAYIALQVKVQNPSIKGSDSVIAMEPLRVATSIKGSNQGAPSSNSSGGGSENTNATSEINKMSDDLLNVFNHMKINNTLQGPISAVRGILKDAKDKDLRFSKRELEEVDEWLGKVFTEFYRKLLLLKNYSFMNLSAFAKIMTKYEKVRVSSMTIGNKALTLTIRSTSAARSYMNIVDHSYLGSSDEVTKLTKNVEHIFDKHFCNANRRRGRKPLRLRPKREKHKVTFCSGFFSGCSIVLIIAMVLMVRARRILEKRQGSFYLDNMFVLYSLFLFIALHMLMYAIDIYFWKRYQVNYAFIFNFKQGTVLGFREVFLLSTGLAVLALASFWANFNMIIGLKVGERTSLAKLIPLLVLLAFFAITFCPFNIIYRSSRFFFLKGLFRCLCAPFYEVTLADFFVADQLTSQVQAIRSIEFYICYYSHPGFPPGQSKCHDHGLYNVFYFVIAVIPYWIRCLQCIRQLIQERDPMHGYNAMKYLMTVVAVIMRTTYKLRKGTTWFVMALISSVMAVTYNTYWDIVVDWGLMRRNSKNLFLRDKILVSHKRVYYIAMVISVLLRAAWLQVILEFNIIGLRKTAILTTISCLEIIRRGIWNFFRLENEHLNNVGRSVPPPFNNDDHNVDEDDDSEKDN